MLSALRLLPLLLAGSNSTEGGLERTREELQTKLEVRCGVSLTITWDHASLKANNQDIAWDQTDGELECNEPLRYLWALCGTAEGQALVRAKGLRQVVCRGTRAPAGSLTVKAGVVTVERAYEERDSFVRAKAQFSAALGAPVQVEANPYSDDAWRAYRREPSPVLSTTDYCLVGGRKIAFDWWAADRIELSRGSQTVKCLAAGEVVIDVQVKDRKRTGVVTEARDGWRRRFSLVADQRDGLEETSEDGRLLTQTMWKLGERIWSKELYPSGALKRYWRQLPREQVTLDLDERGKVYGLSCSPLLKDDAVLRAWCGFTGERTTQVYDGSGAVNQVLTFRDGVLTRRAAGTSRSASGSTVSFVDGEPDGEERITRGDGTLAQTVTWRRGIKHGPEREFWKDGQKLVTERTWVDGALKRREEYFLNGKKKIEEVSESPTRRQRTTYFDLGVVQETGGWLACKRPWSDGWCEDGLHTSFYESGKKHAELRWTAGVKQSATTWYETGELAEALTWTDGRVRSRKAYLLDGGVEADEVYEEDGSRISR
jgi:antitoxin component YwqK of YwqJK toxin-antitoxin module